MWKNVWCLETDSINKTKRIVNTWRENRHQDAVTRDKAAAKDHLKRR